MDDLKVTCPHCKEDVGVGQGDGGETNEHRFRSAHGDTQQSRVLQVCVRCGEEFTIVMTLKVRGYK